MPLSLLITTDSDDGSGFWITVAMIILVAILIAWVSFRVDAIVRRFKGD